MDREVELREFVSARGAALSRAAYLLTGNHQAAEDLVQGCSVGTVKSHSARAMASLRTALEVVRA